MKKKAFALFMALLLTFSTMAANIVPVAADGELGAQPVSVEDIKKASDAVSDAVDELDSIFSSDQAKKIISAFTAFSTAFKSAASYAGAINATVTFLKLIGVVKDGNAEALHNIMAQLNIIGEQLTDMDRKLNQLTEKMSAIQASVEFNARTEKAILLETNWKDFQYRYMEEGLDKLMTDYNSLMLTGMQLWCKNEGNARNTNGIDSRSLVLAYKKDGSTYALIYNTDNGTPTSATPGDRVLVLDESLLPTQVSWNVNTYRSSIKTAIINNMKTRLGREGAAAFETANFPEFAEGGTATDALLNQLAEDAVDLLTYRVAATQINKDSAFSLQVQRQFSNYCTHLLTSNEGIDAMAKVMYLTHAFEYQISDDYKAFFNQMAVKTGVYGTFALTVLGMSAFITDEEKVNAMNSYCRTVLAVDRAKFAGLTGKPNYCYLTNSCLSFGEICFTSNATSVTTHRGYYFAYRSYSASTPETVVTYGKSGKQDSADRLIGDDDMNLLLYSLRGSGDTLSFDFLNNNLGDGVATNYGSTVISLVGKQTLSLNDTNPLKVTNIIGNYFKGKSTVKLSSLPSGADGDDVVYRSQMVGSLMDTSTGSIASNKMLSALAIYGESYFIWETDENAFLGGPTNYGSFHSEWSQKTIDVEFPGTDVNRNSYTQTVRFNCLIKSPLVSFGGDTDTPVASFTALCEEIRDSLKDPDSEQEPDVAPEKALTFGRAWPHFAAAAVLLAAAILIPTLIVKSRKKKKQAA